MADGIMYQDAKDLLNGKFFSIILMTCLFLYPFASGLRGFNLQVGNAAMFLADIVLIFLFIVSVTVINVKVSDFIVAVFILSALVHVVSNQSPDVFTLYQGFRKSILWIICISLGARLCVSQSIVFINGIFVVCVFICLYSVKQSLMPGDFDRGLLSIQAANEYTNRIGDTQRSISILSSAFHVSFAAVLLLSISLCADWYSKLLRLAGVLCAAAGLYFSHTRTFAIIAILIVILHFLKLNIFRSLILLALLVNGALISLILYGFDPLDYVYAFFQGDDRFLNRSESYIMYSRYMYESYISWFAGHGLGSAGSTMGDKFASFDLPWIEPHNIFLKYLFEFGYIFGSAALLVLAYIWMVGCKQIYHSQLAKMNFYFGITLIISGLTITSVEAIPISLYVGTMFGTNFVMRGHNA